MNSSTRNVRSSASMVLDAWALLAYLLKQPGGDRVRSVLREAATGEVHLSLCLMNYGEVLYSLERRWGRNGGRRAAATLAALPLSLAPVSKELVEEAARVKAYNRLSYADAFAVATAMHLGATILTGDPEFHAVENDVRIEWLA
jgi:uncharacterized protein